MKRLVQIGAACAAVVAIGLVVLLLTNPRVDVQISEVRAQQALDARLPIVHDDGPVKYRIISAAIAFRDSGRAQLIVTVELKTLNKSATARVTASAEPFYADGAFFLRDFHAENTEILQSSLPPGELAMIEALVARIPGKTQDKLSELIDSQVESVLQERPVYRLQPTDFKHTIARMILSDIRVGSGRIDATLDPLGGGLRPVVLLVLAIASVATIALIVSVAMTRRRG
jgi:hypothetical protein